MQDISNLLLKEQSKQKAIEVKQLEFFDTFPKLEICFDFVVDKNFPQIPLRTTSSKKNRIRSKFIEKRITQPCFFDFEILNAVKELYCFFAMH